MRMLNLVLAEVLLAVPLAAQDPAKEPAKEPSAETPKAAEAEPAKPQITPEGEKLLEDIKRVYAKYYELVLAKIKADQSYKADEVWDAAVKEAKNATYKDSKEWTEAVLKMKKADKVFSRLMTEYVNKAAKEHAEAVGKWVEESGGK